MTTRTRAHLIWVILPLIVVSLPGRASAQAHSHEHADEQARALHFSHPIFTESVTPHTGLRLSFGATRVGAGGDGWSSQIGLGAEYAFHRTFSLEVQLPYVTGLGIGETHMALKFASHVFEDSGVLLGYGVEFGLPTGTHAGPEVEGEADHPHVEGHSGISEIEPFLGVGWTAGRWQLLGSATFGLPTSPGDGPEIGPEVSLDASVLYHLSDRVEALLEYDSESWSLGPGPRAALSHVSPGLKVRPLADSPLVLALGASFPTLSQDHFDTRLRMAAFYHF